MQYKQYIKFLILSPLFFVLINAQDTSNSSSFDGKKAYEYLMHDRSMPFAMGIGTSLSQTHISDNTVNPEFIRKKMLEIAKKMSLEEGKKWLTAENRVWYLLRSMPQYTCKNGHIINVTLLDSSFKKLALDDILYDFIVKNELRLETCPVCQEKIQFQTEQQNLFTTEMQDSLVSLIHDLNVDIAATSKMPNARLSIEIADVLKKGTIEIDETKLNSLVSFINKIGNPMIFLHHYANPAVLPNLFEKKEHAEWFADICQKIIEKLPNITHVCPVSQPTGFIFRVTRNQDLPPFEYTIDQDQLLDNIMASCALAGEKMKAIRRIQAGAELKVLVSHQWKIMTPKHTSYLDPRYGLELLVTTIADKMYNGKFVNAVQPYISNFDGIALSVYPALKFDMWTPEGSNIAGTVDYEGSMSSILEANKAFPDKDIYIVEAGCNNVNPEIKKNYIDMMLSVCVHARQKQIPVKSLYFWGITNDPDFYMEWNTAKGTTYFGPYDGMSISSINQAGQYIKEIISSVKSKY